ncbi:amidohydrolase [Chloroflexota bacterium]
MRTFDAMMEHNDFGNTADLILHNAQVITLDPEQPYADLVAIRGNRILAAGHKGDLGLFKGAETELVDCAGGTVIPGFNDAHCHPFSLAVSLLGVDCSPEAVKNIAEIQSRIRHRAEKSGEGKWIRAAGYDEFHLQEKRPPNRWELDQVSPRHPVILTHYTAGSCVLNSLALQMVGITGDTPESSGSLIHRDPETGQPNGVISGRNEHAERAIPPLDEGEIEQGMKLVNREYLSHGITSIQDATWTNGRHRWQTWQRLVEREIVSSRVSMLLGTQSLEEFQNAGLSMDGDRSRLRVGGVKLALDESTGCPHPSQEDIDRHALKALGAGYQVAFHVSDVYTLQAALSAIKFLSQQAPAAEHRFRLEHCSFCPPDLLLMVKASQAIVVTQPAFLYYMGDKYREEVLTRQAGWLWPVGSFHRWGVKTAFSSDSPLVTSNPLTGIYAAVTRKTETGQKLAPQESISPLEALKMYTLWGAYASSEEEEKGSISPGKLADLAVLSDDPLQKDPEELRGLNVIRTIIDGKVIWEN